MQTYYEIEIDIPVNRQLVIQLSDFIPAGRAKIVITYEQANLPEHSAASEQLARLGGSAPQLSGIPRRKTPI
ncbi:MAG: hypothetical protein Q8N96_04360 [Methylovulum sp.]|nr:hypothetical protein [Methylovulum sp.]